MLLIKVCVSLWLDPGGISKVYDSKLTVALRFHTHKRGGIKAWLNDCCERTPPVSSQHCVAIHWTDVMSHGMLMNVVTGIVESQQKHS